MTKDDENQFDVDGGSSAPVHGMPLVPKEPSPVGPSPYAPPSLAPQPAAVTEPAAITQKASNPRPMPGMPPDVDHEELGRYLGGQKEAIEKYGPAQQLETEQNLIKARTGAGASVANAGAGLADAIMQGVAGAGNPGFQRNLQEQGNQLAGEASGAMERARTGGMDQMKAEMEVDQNDPSSPLSKVAQASYGPTLTAMGASREQIAKMPASMIADVEGKRITLEDALARIEETGAYQQGMLGVRQAELGNKEREFKAEHPVLTALGFLGGGSSSGGESKAPPMGDSVVRDGKTYQWSPSTGKYHLVR